MTAFTQLDEALRAGSLRTIAVLRYEPGDLAERYGLRFTEAPSNLGESLAALVQTRPGRQFMLLGHVDAPTPGTEVLASDQFSDPVGDLHEFLAAFDLNSDAVTWSLDRDHPAVATR